MPEISTGRRSQSATRSLSNSTMNFMGRIGQSLRIASSSRQRQKDLNMQMDCSVDVVDKRQSLVDQWDGVRLQKHSKFQREWPKGVRSEELSRKHSHRNDLYNTELKLLTPMSPKTIRLDESISSALSPLSNTSYFSGGRQSRSATPRPTRRHYLKEGFCQLTSIETFSNHHRYMFLFDDLLLICKQKGENSYKLKEKVPLEFLWLSSNNCTNSFLIGWPPSRNFIAHFSSEREKADWFDKLDSAIQRQIQPKSTTISVFIQIDGRYQQIRHKIQNGQKTDELTRELINELNLSELDPHLGHYELCLCTGTAPKRSRNPSGFLSTAPNFSTSFASSTTPSPAILRRVHSQTSIAAPSKQGEQYQNSIQPLHGVENVYAIVMDFVRNKLSISLSDSQLAHLDICPLVNCRLLLRQTNPHQIQNVQNKSTSFNLVHQFKKVLGRAESATTSLLDGQKPKARKRLFGRPLLGSMPPQPVLTMIDHLLLYGSDVEGIFRKSPKQQTVRVLRQQMDQGQVPDFHQFSVHVTASLLKDYLRSIPGQLLLSGNYPLWKNAITCSELSKEERLERCQKLLAFLPPAHTVLLRSLLRLLRKIASNETQTKMGVSALAVCIAPSFLENLEQVESVRVISELVMFLIENATTLFDGFREDGPLLPDTFNNPMSANPSGQSPMHQSTDSGLSEVGATISTTAMGSKRRLGTEQRSISPDSGKLSSEPPSEEDDDCCENGRIQLRWMKAHSLDHEELMDNEEKTPVVLSRENSDVKDNAIKAMSRNGQKFTWHSEHLCQAENGTKTGLKRSPAILSPGSRKCSTTSTMLERNLSPNSSAATPRKVSTQSTTSVDSNGSKGTAAHSRRALLMATKSEALGLPADLGKDGSRKNSMTNTISASGSPRVARLTREFVSRQQQQHVAKPQLQRAHPLNTATQRAPFPAPSPKWTPQLEKRPSSAFAHMANGANSSLASSACPSPSLSDRMPQNLRRSSAGTTHATNSNYNGKLGNQKKYVPPKKTAEELLLDKLEVNWSVPQIRKQFQQSAANGPAPVIDTLYAILPGQTRGPK